LPDRLRRKGGREERLPGVRQFVEHHLPVAAGGGEVSAAQYPEVMRDQVLRAFRAAGAGFVVARAGRT